MNCIKMNRACAQPSRPIFWRWWSWQQRIISSLSGQGITFLLFQLGVFSKRAHFWIAFFSSQGFLCTLKVISSRLHTQDFLFILLTTGTLLVPLKLLPWSESSRHPPETTATSFQDLAHHGQAEEVNEGGGKVERIKRFLYHVVQLVSAR